MKDMNKYESVIIINPKIGDEKIKETMKKIENLIKTFKIECEQELEIQDLGKKKLAYEVRGNKEGYYVIYNFYAVPENIAELERVYRITEEILKFIVVRND